MARWAGVSSVEAVLDEVTTEDLNPVNVSPKTKKGLK